MSNFLNVHSVGWTLPSGHNIFLFLLSSLLLPQGIVKSPSDGKDLNFVLTFLGAKEPQPQSYFINQDGKFQVRRDSVSGALKMGPKQYRSS